MSCGLPVIVSVNTGSADVVQDGVNGFVVPVCDPTAIMERLEYLYRSPERCREMERETALLFKPDMDEYGEEVTKFFETMLGGFHASQVGQRGATQSPSIVRNGLARL